MNRLLAVMACIVAAMASGSVRADDQVVTETLYNFHSVRTSRALGCSRLDWPTPSPPFLAVVEDTWNLYSYRTRASDGLVVETITKSIGTQRGCWGLISQTATAGRYFFLGEAHFGDVDVTLSGYCDSQRNFPFQPVAMFTCSWQLSGDGIVGGHYVTTTPSVEGMAFPPSIDPDPLGFHEAGFVTIRLWK